MNAAHAMGSVALWGFSPAIDFTVGSTDGDAFEFWNKESSDAVTILLVGAPDLCHVLQNLPEALRRTDRRVDFYLMENSVEVYARQLLLLWLLCEPPDSVGLQEKVWMFMEIVGNTLVRPSTARYIEDTATKLMDLVASGDGESAALPLVSLADLRHRERDQLAAVFQFWRAPGAAADVAHMWDLRLRQQLAQRYDARRGVFDWDYFMRLKDRLATEFVQPDEYKHWRETGVAFRRPGTEQTCANRTLVTARALGRPGERQLRRGYWGDIVSGPFAPFGLRTDDPRLSRRQNGRVTTTAADVCAANLEALFQCVGAALPGAAHVRVRLLPADGGATLGRRAVHRRRFDAALFSSGMSHLLTPPLAGCLRDGAVVVLETARYIVCVSAEQQERLVEKYEETADTAGCRLMGGREGSGCREPARQEGRSEGDQQPKTEIGERGKELSHLKRVNAEEEDRHAALSDDSEERGTPAATDAEVTVKSTEVAAAEKISASQGTVTEGGQHTPAASRAVEEDRRASATTADSRAGNNVPSLTAEADVGDKPSPVCIGKEDSPTLLVSGGADKPTAGIAEDGAGEPKAASAVFENADKTASAAEVKSEKPGPPAAREENGTPLLDLRDKREKEVSDSTNGKIETDGVPAENQACSSGGLDESNTNSTPAAECDGGQPSATEPDRKRRWASDKLTSIPEWVCFVKRRTDSVIS